MAATVLLSFAIAFVSADVQAPQDLADRAERHFEAGRVAESVATYDSLAALVPSVAPMLWQRGIGLYLLGRYDECAAQFLANFRENPGDLENASWHFLCVARAKSIDDARAAMLVAGPDPRILRPQIYEMLRGERTPSSLVTLVTGSVPIARFYAYLYAGLLCDATGDRAGAIAHLDVAASEPVADSVGFMSAVARIYLKHLTEQRTR
jgi:lipoprotein NlpI